MSQLRYLPRILLIGLAILLIGIAYQQNWHAEFEVEQLRTHILETGVWGPLFFILILSFLQPTLHLSSTLFLLAASLVWSRPVAFFISWLGVVGTGLTSFFFARYLARDWVQRHIPQKLQQYNEKLATEGFKTVFILRFFFFTTPAVQLMIGLTPVRFLPFLGATILGTLPGTLFITQFGAFLPILIEKYNFQMWHAIVLLIALFLLAALFYYYWFHLRNQSASIKKDR